MRRAMPGTGPVRLPVRHDPAGPQAVRLPVEHRDPRPRVPVISRWRTSALSCPSACWSSPTADWRCPLRIGRGTDSRSSSRSPTGCPSCPPLVGRRRPRGPRGVHLLLADTVDDVRAPAEDSCRIWTSVSAWSTQQRSSTCSVTSRRPPRFASSDFSTMWPGRRCSGRHTRAVPGRPGRLSVRAGDPRPKTTPRNCAAVPPSRGPLHRSPRGRDQSQVRATPVSRTDRPHR
jgi:hypothetical protein